LIVHAEDNEVQVRMKLHQPPSDVCFPLTGQRQIHNNQIRFESRDSFHQGPFVSHHQNGLEKCIEQAVDAAQHAQMTIRQEYAAMLHGVIHPSESNDDETPATARIQLAELPVGVTHESEPESQVE